MTATASRTDVQCIQDSLGLKKCKHIIGNPNRKNIFYKKVFRTGKDMNSLQTILMPIARALLEQNIDYPVTIVYIPLRLFGFAYNLFEHVLGVAQYFPLGSPQSQQTDYLLSFMLPKRKK